MAADQPWIAPSVPVAELSGRPVYEVRSVKLDMPDGGITVYYRHEYTGRDVDVIDIARDLRE